MAEDNDKRDTDGPSQDSQSSPPRVPDRRAAEARRATSAVATRP
jgi:hypothetical protein